MKKQQRLNWSILHWDTDFFGFVVARIIPKKLDLEILKSILLNLKERDVSLVYWATESADKDSQMAGESLGGFLADHKITYIIDLKKEIPIEPLAVKVEEYNKNTPSLELINLAIQSGLYSRYNTDPKFSKRQFEDLYKTWITKSTDRTIADAVLVVKRNKKIVGMITLGEKNSRGNIGLIAVDAHMRNMGIGRSLTRAAHSWFISRGYEVGEVVTQEVNTDACRLFEKSGYHIEKIENFYHFWL